MTKCKKVLQISYYNNRLINEFSSIVEAATKLGISKSNISQACRGKLRSAGGYQWRFKESV